MGAARLPTVIMPQPSPQPVVFKALQELAAEEPVTLRVAGECMHPLLPDGVEVQVAPGKVYLPGDILAFVAPCGEMRIHRLIGYRPLHPGGRFQTRADASGKLDPPFGRAQLIGRVLGKGERWQVRAGDRVRAAGRFLKLAVQRLLPA